MCSGRGGAGWRGRVPAAASHQPNQGNGVKQGICSLLFQEHLLQDCADSPRPGAGLTELQSMGGGDQPQHPELPLERPLHQGSARAPPGAGLCLQSGAGTPGMVGSSYPRAPAPSAPRPSRHCGGDRKRAPKDEGMGMTCPGLSLAVATAEPRQHEMLLAKQPGDPAEEIGPFKRDSDK